MPTFRLKKRNFEPRLRRTRNALLEVFPQNVRLKVAGRATSRNQIVAQLDKTLARFEAVRAAKAAWQHALEVLHADLVTTHALHGDLRLLASVRFGQGSPQVAALGFASKPPRPRTPAEQAVSAALRLQTRGVRGTLGKRQRKALGDLKTQPRLVVVAPDGTPLPDPKKKG